MKKYATQSEQKLHLAESHEMNVQAKADSEHELANANGRLVVEERLRYESEVYANRPQTPHEAFIANQIRSQVEKQRDHNLGEIAQQALALDTAKRALAFQEGLVAAANRGDPAIADAILQQALREAEAMTHHHQEEHLQALRAMTKFQHGAREHQANMDAMTNEANRKVAQAQAVMR